jgi:hypothetical protein
MIDKCEKVCYYIGYFIGWFIVYPIIKIKRFLKNLLTN